jgi:hypothetical protein
MCPHHLHVTSSLHTTSSLWASGFCASTHSTSPDCRTQKGFQDNLSAPLLDVMVIKDSPFSQIDSMAPTPQVLSSLSLVKYHADCGFILLLLLLSFVTRPSYPLGSQKHSKFRNWFHLNTISTQNLGSKDHLCDPSRLSIETMAPIPYCNIPDHQPHHWEMLIRENILILIYITCIKSN